MGVIKPEAIEHEIKRFMRPDWRRYWKPGHENDPLYRLYESVERKFDPDQPRVEAGNPDGGQWTSGDGGSSNTAPTVDPVDTDSIVAQAKRIAATDPNRYEECLNLCVPILERFQPPGSDRNQWDFHKCMNRCLGR